LSFTNDTTKQRERTSKISYDRGNIQKKTFKFGCKIHHYDRTLAPNPRLLCNSVYTHLLLYQRKPIRSPDVFASLMDTTVNSGDDFFQYAHGTWIKNNPRSASETSWGIHREVLNEVYDRLKKICEEAAQNPGDMKSTQMVGRKPNSTKKGR